MEDEERTSCAILFHKVLTFIDFAQLEFVKQDFFDFLIFNERGEGEVGPETFEDAELIVGALVLRDF